MCYVKVVLQNLTKLTGKSLYQSLFFIKVYYFLKKRPWHKCFLLNFAKFLRIPFWQNAFGWLLLARTVGRCDLIWTKLDIEVKNYNSSSSRVFCKIAVFKNFTDFTGENLCRILFLRESEIEALEKVFSCKYCEIFEKSFFRNTYERLFSSIQEKIFILA